MSRRKTRADDAENTEPLVLLVSEEEMHNYLPDAASKAERCADKSRALLAMGKFWIDEQDRIRDAAQTGRKVELSPGMHLAATQSYIAAGIFELARAIHESAAANQAVPRPALRRTRQ